MLVAALSLLLGAAVTCLLVLAPLYAFGHAWGWLLHERGVLVWAHGQASASVTAWTWWLAPVAAAGLTLILFLAPGGEHQPSRAVLDLAPAANGRVLAGYSAHARHALGRGRRAHELPRYLDQRD